LQNTQENRQQIIDSKPVRLQLKWFNGSKGFGFLVPEDGSYDAFVHITTLQDAGLNMVGEGAIFDCELSDGPKGKQVERILKVIQEGKVNLMPQPENEDGTITMGGIVKWYKPEKGFGFIIPDDGMKDVFIHKTLLDKLEIEALEAGQRVKVTLKMVDKGREAVAIEVIR
jgi:CspA family cold shock protein